MVEDERVAARPPAFEVLLTADVGGAGVEDAPLPALDARTAAVGGAPQQHLVHTRHPVGFRVAQRAAEKVLAKRKTL